MATRTWNSSGSTDMNDGANYTGSGELLTSDDLVFDDTSVVNAIATADLSVNSITTTSGYSGNWSTGVGHGFTVAAGVSFDHTGSLDIRGACSIGSGGCHIGSGIGTLVTIGSSFTFTDDCTVDVNKPVTTGAWTIDAGVSVVVSGSSNMFIEVSDTVDLTMGDGASLTASCGSMFRVYKSQDGAFMSLGSGCAIKGTAALYFVVDGGATCTLPAFTYTGSGAVKLTNASLADAGSTIKLTGNLNVGTSTCEIFNSSSSANATFAFDTDGYNITCGSFCPGNNKSSGETATLYYRNSSISCTSIRGWYDGAAGTTINMGSATISCSGGIWALSNCTYNVGTSVTTITGESTLTSNGKKWTSMLAINAPSATVKRGQMI